MLRGTRIASAYMAITADGSGINEEIVDSVDAAGDDIEDKGREHGDRYGNKFSDGFLSRIKNKAANRLSGLLGSEEGAGKAGDEAGTSFVDRMSDKVKDMGDRIGSELSDRLASNPEQVRRGIDRAFNDDMLDRVGDRVGARLARSMGESIERQSAVITAAVDRVLDDAVSGNSRRVKRDSGGLGDVIGRMLGAGSRNNALNLFGKSIGNITGLIAKVTFGAVGMFSVFQKGFAGAAEGASLFTRIGGGAGAVGARMSAAFAGLAASIPTLLIGLAAVFVSMTLLVSVASALLAILTALASTITSALVAALAVGSGGLVAFAAAAGLATLAFTSMTNAQSKALKTAFQPLKAEATGLGQIMIRQMVPAFEAWSKNLQLALLLIKPLAEVMGGAFARAGTILTESLSGRGMQMLITSLSVNLPRIITNLSSAFGGFLNGIAGTFAAIMPFVLRFSGYLSRVASDFARWATSANGQNSITDFVERALNSLASLWNFIKAVGGLISTVLFNPRGQRTGDNIFDRMAGSLRDFTAYISKENRLEDWFKRGEKFARLLGKAIKKVGEFIEDLDNSKTIDVLWAIYQAGKSAHEWWVKMPDVFTDLMNPLSLLLGPLQGLINGFKELAGWMNQTSNWTPPPGMLSGGDALNQLLVGPMTTHPNFIGPTGPDTPAQPPRGASSLQDLINSGNAALDATFESNGGNMPDPTKGPRFTHFEGGLADSEWVNPYLAFVEQMLATAQTLADEIRASAKEARGNIRAAMKEAMDGFQKLLSESFNSFSEGVAGAVTSTDVGAIVESFSGIIENAGIAATASIEEATTNAAQVIADATTARNQMIASAQAARDAALQRLGSASNEKEAKAALRALQQADANLNLAKQKGDALVREAQESADRMLSGAKDAQTRVDNAASILAGQAVLTLDNAYKLTQGLAVQNATLADYAEARRWAAESLATANQRLADAVALRDNYGAQVTESIKAFGSLLTAQAKTLNGVEQSLTSSDITDNLRARLEKIKKFNDNLRLLLAQGLSNDAYKQIVDAGVETGGAFAEALLQGGQGAISEVNSLTAQIGKASEGIGAAAASQMYQAGVDAAQGLVDGLLSLSAQLDSAAAALGASIAAAIKRELGIASPSKVAYGLMFNGVGDGMVNGLDASQVKVGSAAARLADVVAVSPEVASYAARQGTSATTGEGTGAVSGNGSEPKFLWTGNIVTPTEDPMAVANEAINEITARL